MNVKTKSYIILGGFTLYVIISMIYYPKLVNMIITSGFLTGVLIYILTNPAYLLLVYGIIRYAKGSKFKALLSSILLIFSLDMIASPRIMVNEILTTGSSTITNMGAIAIKAIANLGLPYKIAWFFYYAVFPILFFAVSMELLGVVDFIKKFRNGGYR